MNSWDSFQVYCDMETDWGGWTFFAFKDWWSPTVSTKRLFDSSVGTYSHTQKDAWQDYSFNISDITHSEMMVLIDEKKPKDALKSKKVIFFKYDIWYWWFNQWPVPCNWLTNWWYTYKTTLSEPYKTGNQSSCSSANWHQRDENWGSGFFLLNFNTNNNWAYWWKWIAWNTVTWADSWNHDARFYVR